MLNADLPIHIGNATVAFSCSIELANLCHPETLGESLPDTWTQPVSHRQSDFVTFFWWSHWLREEVSANLPNILHHLEWEGLNYCSADCKPVRILECLRSQVLTVQLYLMQSSQKRLAENFFFTTTVTPCIRHWPTPMILPGERNTSQFSFVNLFPSQLEENNTCWVVERKTVVDDVIRAHAKGKIAKSSNSVIAVVGTEKRFSCAKSLTSLKSGCLHEEITDCAPQWQP